jgi:hypothetical protein
VLKSNKKAKKVLTLKKQAHTIKSEIKWWEFSNEKATKIFFGAKIKARG